MKHKNLMSAQAAPQLSIRAIALSIVLAMILAAANTYLGLFAVLTIASAIPAAVVSMAVLRAFGGGHILENNIVQTGASAAASIAAGVIFTIPALVIIGYWPDFKYGWVLTIAGLGGILGVLFSVPLRRSLIIEQGLAFPEGKAAAEVLRAGDNPARGLKILATAGRGYSAHSMRRHLHHHGARKRCPARRCAKSRRPSRLRHHQAL
jgi:putative OPT family oligopeptide transporter